MNILYDTLYILCCITNERQCTFVSQADIGNSKTMVIYLWLHQSLFSLSGLNNGLSHALLSLLQLPLTTVLVNITLSILSHAHVFSLLLIVVSSLLSHLLLQYYRSILFKCICECIYIYICIHKWTMPTSIMVMNFHDRRYIKWVGNYFKSKKRKRKQAKESEASRCECGWNASCMNITFMCAESIYIPT